MHSVHLVNWYQELGIEPESFLKTVNRYKNQIQQAFGILRFKVGERKGEDNPEGVFLTTGF